MNRYSGQGMCAVTAEAQERKECLLSTGLIVLFVIVLCSLIVPPAGAQPEALTGARTTIRAVIPDDVPPTYYRDPKTHKAAGFAVDVMDEIAVRAGLSVVYSIEKDWPAVIDAVRSGRADIAPLLGMSEERTEILAFTMPVETVPVSLFVRSDNTTISALRTGIVVGVLHGSAAYEVIKKQYPSGIELKNYDNFSNGLLDLLAGKIDVFCCPATTLTHLARNAGLKDRIKIVGVPVLELKRGMAMRKDDTELFAKIDTVTKAFVGSPEYLGIYTKWFGKAKPFLAVSKTMFLGAIMLFIAIGAMALWRYYSLIGLNRMLRQEISERTLAEEALRNSEKRYHQLFENMQEGFMIQDIVTDDAGKPMDVRYLDVNPAIERFLGKARAEIIGKTRTQVIGIHDPAVVEANSRVAVTGQPFHMERYSSGVKRWYESFSYSFGPGQVATLVLDITERKLAEEQVRQNEAKFRNLFDSATDGIFILGLDGYFIDVNTTACTRLGYSKEEMLALHISKLDHPEFAPLAPERMKQVQEHGFAVFESAHLRKDGTAMPVEVNSRLMDFEGRTVFFSMIRDITDRKKTEKALRESEKRYHILFDQSPDGILLIDTTGKILEFNEAAHLELGYSREEFAQLHLSDLDPVESPEEIRDRLAKIQEMGQARFDVKHRTKRGEVRDVDIIAQAMILSDKPVVHTIWHDITERKKAEELILRSLKEKEVLLKEIHHRVKNNMQVIYSLLNLQANRIADTTIRAMFEDARNRVNSMALIHEKLYQSQDLAHIDFKEYLQGLVSGIARTYNRHDVVLSVEMEPLALDVNVGIPCGLIVNELVSNGLKYAFPEGRKGTIAVGVRQNSEGSYVLTVADNGIGVPETVDFRNTPSLGLQLVNILTGQIRGTIELSHAAGSTFSITFPGTPESKGEQNG